MGEFKILVNRIRGLWDILAEIEDVLYIGPSETPEIAADKIKREIKNLQQYVRTLNKNERNKTRRN